MNTMILDPQLQAKLNGCNDVVDVLDDRGNTVGHFLPSALYQKLACALANAQVSDEELRQISREKGGRSLADIWKDLGQS